MKKERFNPSNNSDLARLGPGESGPQQQAVPRGPFANKPFFNRRLPLVFGLGMLLCLSGPSLTTAWGQNSAPVMNANLTMVTMNAKVGEPFCDTIFASGTPNPSYSCTGLPGGLAVNASSGAITGTPNTPGTFHVGLTAANSVGSVTSNLTLTVYPTNPTTATFVMRLITTTNPPTGSPFGYLEYLPTQYNTTTNAKFPILIFHHGANFMGIDGGSNMWNTLWLLSTTGPGEVISSGGTVFDLNNCIVLMPISWNPWEEPQMPEFYTWVLNNYKRVDTNRVYMQGWSRGADGVLSYLNTYSSQIAAVSACALAVSPGSGIGPVTSVYTNIPIWECEDWDDPYKGNNFQNWLDPIATEYDRGGSVPDVMANYPGGSTPTAIYSATYAPSTGWTWFGGSAIATNAPPLRMTMNPSGGHGGELWNMDNVTPSFWAWLFEQNKTNAPNTATNSGTNSAPPTSAQGSPVLYWPFIATDSTGTNIPDAAGYGNTGQMLNPGSTGTKLASTGGIFGGPCLTISSSATANGSGGVVFAASNATTVATLSTYPFSVALWCKGTSLLSMWAFTDPNLDFHVLYGPEWANAVENVTGSSYLNDTIASGSTYADGNWHHWCITYNAPGNRSFYIDGQPSTYQASYSGAPDLTTPLFYFSVGCRELSPTDVDNVCAGYSLQDCAIWNRQLSPQSIAAVYALGHFGVAGAGTAAVTNFLNAYSNQTSVIVSGTPWNYVTGLSGAVGAVTGTLAAGTAAVDLDTTGGGMRVGVAGGPPIINSFAAAQIITYLGDGPVTLNYNVSTNSQVTTITPTVGVLAGVYNGVGTGSVTVNPTATTSYWLIASNVYAAISNFVTVTVLPPPAPPHLVLNWGLDENSGTTVNNFDGNTNYVGQFFTSGNPPEWTASSSYPGVAGDSCLFFDDTNGLPYVECVSTALANAISNYPFTVSVWVNLPLVIGSGSGAATVLEPDLVGGTAEAADFITLNASYPYMDIWSPSADVNDQIDPGGAGYPYSIFDQNWHLETVVYESAAHFRAFTDGIQYTEAWQPIPVPIGVQNSFTIGAGTYYMPPRDAFVGLIDEPAIWSGRLTTNNVAMFCAATLKLGLKTFEAEALRTAYNNNTSATVQGYVFYPASGLAGTLVNSTPPGTGFGGTLTNNGNAYVLMDNAGHGMAMATGSVPPGIQPTLSASISGTTATIQGVGTPGASYILQTATNVAGPWWPLSTNTAASGTGTLLLTDPNATNTTQFYRTLP